VLKLKLGQRRTCTCLLTALLLVSFHPRAAAQSSKAGTATAAQLEAAREYIRSGWRTLSRSNRDLPKAAEDPKFAPAEGGRWPVYVSGREDLSGVERGLRAA
jgi:hypothetical protein